MSTDIDLDFGDRLQALQHIKHTPASIMRNGEWTRHNSGVYVTPVPCDPVTGLCSLDYEQADALGYFKLDFLNVGVYQQVTSPEHLTELMTRTPPWHRLKEREFVEQVIHINAHWDLLQRMPEAVDTIPRMAMFLSVIRPAKRHLAGKVWREVAQTVWDKPQDNSYYFKKSHAVSYAHLVVVHMNLIDLANQGN